MFREARRWWRERDISDPHRETRQGLKMLASFTVAGAAGVALIGAGVATMWEKANPPEPAWGPDVSPSPTPVAEQVYTREVPVPAPFILPPE